MEATDSLKHHFMTLAHFREPSQRPVLGIQHVSMLGKATLKISPPLRPCRTVLLGNPEVCGRPGSRQEGVQDTLEVGADLVPTATTTH